MQIQIMISIVKLYSLEFLAYPLETLMLLLRRVFEVGLLVLFWYLVSQDNDISGFQVLPYIFIASGALYLSLGHNFPQADIISKDIKEGRLNNMLIRPFNELMYELGAFIGKSLFILGFAVVSIFVGLALVEGLTLARLALFVLSLAPAILIGYALNILIAALAFWIIETGNVRLISYFIIRIISGMYLPLTFFTGALGVLLQLLPFAQLAFVPSFVLTSDDLQKSFFLVFVGFVEAFVMIKLARMLWAKGLRRYGAVGI